jgi:hypothetical protein
MTPEMMYSSQTFKRIDGYIAMGERQDYTLLACKLATGGVSGSAVSVKLSVKIKEIIPVRAFFALSDQQNTTCHRE